MVKVSLKLDVCNPIIFLFEAYDMHAAERGISTKWRTIFLRIEKR